MFWSIVCIFACTICQSLFLDWGERLVLSLSPLTKGDLRFFLAWVWSNLFWRLFYMFSIISNWMVCFLLRSYIFCSLANTGLFKSIFYLIVFILFWYFCFRSSSNSWGVLSIFVLISTICFFQLYIAPFCLFASSYCFLSSIFCCLTLPSFMMMSCCFFSIAYFLSTFLSLSLCFYSLFILSCRSISALRFSTWEALENRSKFLALRASDFCDETNFASESDTLRGTSGSWFTTSLVALLVLPKTDMLRLSPRPEKFLFFFL